MTATTLWAAVVLDYDADGLITLTNINDRAATAIDTTAGEAAAQAVINIWPAYAETEYDADNALHVEVAEMGVIAMLWRRGGSSTSIEKVKWDEVFGSEGLVLRVRRTGARGRSGPSSNSGVTQRAEARDGQRVLGWSDPEARAMGHLPNRRRYNED